MTQTIILHYGPHQLDAIQMGGQMWLRVSQIVTPLGFRSETGLANLLARNNDEFGADETQLVTLPTEGGDQQVRVFSLRGVRLLALLARTRPAKAFRRWCLDVLEGRRRPRAVQGLLALPGTHTLPEDTLRVIEQVEQLIEPDHPARAVLADFKTGSRALPEDPRLSLLASRFVAQAAAQSETSRALNAIRKDAARLGYSLDAVRAEAKRQGREAHVDA